MCGAYSHAYNQARDMAGRIVAGARHLAAAAFWVLTKDQDYRPPQAPPPSKPAVPAASSTNG